MKDTLTRPVVLALVTLVFAVIITAPKLSIQTDSAEYLRAAQHFAAAGEFRGSHFCWWAVPEVTNAVDCAQWDDYYLTWRGPLYPVLLSVTGYVGARWLNVAAAVITALCVYHLAGRGWVGFAAGVLAVLALSYSLVWVMTESVFVAFTVLAMVSLPAVLPASIASTAAVMTRYNGVVLVFLAALYLWRVRGWQAAAAYLTLPGAALVWWLSRNYYLTGRFGGIDGEPFYTVWHNIATSIMTLAPWAAVALVVLAGVALVERRA